MKKLLYTHIIALVLLSTASYATKDTPINLTNINDNLKENDQPIITENELIDFTDYDVPNFMLYPTNTLDNSEPPLKKQKIHKEANDNGNIFNVKNNKPHKKNEWLTAKQKDVMMNDIINYVLCNMINYTTNVIIDEINTKASSKEKEDMDKLISDATEYIKENIKNNIENESIQTIYDEISKKIKDFYYNGNSENVTTGDKAYATSRMFSDRIFNYGLYEFAKIHSANAPMFLYYNDFKPEFSFAKAFATSNQTFSKF